MKNPNQLRPSGGLISRRDSRRNRRRARKRTTVLVVAGLGVVLAGAVAFFAGPRVDTAFRPKPIVVPAEVEQYVAGAEKEFGDLVPGAEKKVVWANPTHARTPLAFVYLHGFSATRQETFPLTDRVAEHFGANAFHTRLTGHGRDGAALASATVSDWLNDALEAVEIGKRLGERVIVVGSSTGGTLATWLAVQQREPSLAYVLISPNFGPKDRRAVVLTWPWASKFVPIAFGATRKRAPQSDAERRYWTTEYPTTALMPMMGLVKVIDESPLESITAPTLVIYSREDPVVDPIAIERTFARIGSVQKVLIPFPAQGRANRHVIAGDIMAPDNTASVADLIIGFVERIAPKAR